MKTIQKTILFIFVVLVRVLNFSFQFIKKCIGFVHKKKRYSIPFYALAIYVAIVFIIIKTAGDSKFDKTIENKRVNDVTQINSIQVNRILKPHSINDIVVAIQSTHGPISIGGGRYSMGGQTAYENSLHLDMREFNKVLKIDTKKRQVVVQSGITWRDLQKIIDKKNLSVKIMQTYANFTVGGSISVNCHGRYIGHGPIISSVLEVKIVNSSGELITASRKENEEIFRAAIGGYGGIGVIVEATLQLEKNEKVLRQNKLVDVEDYYDFFNKNIRNDSTVIFQNGDLYPPNYNKINNVYWTLTEKELTDTTRVTGENKNYWLEKQFIQIASFSDIGKWIRQKIISPYLYSTEEVVWRNKEASYDVMELEPKSREKYTYVLQEYFIPVNNIESFIPKMKAVFDTYEVNVLNVSIRHAYPDKESYLSWADEEVFAFVVYYKQKTDDASKAIVKQWTIEMTDAILSEKGKWYLPYQVHATKKQFSKGFPNADKYFEVKNSVDSLHRFNNNLLDKYNPFLDNSIENERENVKGYFRDEEQTFLTVPEWYLVFNPKEYSDFLEKGNNPSDFPFYDSVREYWKLYDRSQTLVEKAYPENKEYNTMLKVIGISTTLEYSLKMIYEKSFGKAFGWFKNDTISKNEQLIIEAHRAYSNFIYSSPWYEFDFLDWIHKIWAVSETDNASKIRKWERTLFFTFEFSFKAVYAKLIEWAAQNSFEKPITDIYLIVSTKELLIPSAEVNIIKEKGDKKIIGISRWGKFTKSIVELSKKEIAIHDISGNDQIVVSILFDKSKQINFAKMEVLYESKIVTNQSKTRLVCLIPVNSLLPFIQYTTKNLIELEHIFDY